MNITPEAEAPKPPENIAGSTPVVDSAVATGMPDMPAAAKPLTSMPSMGDLKMPEIKATADARAAEVTAAKNSPAKPGVLNRVLGAMGFRGGNVAPSLNTVGETPAHLIPTATGFETPPVANLHDATADGPAVTKFAEPVAVIPEAEAPVVAEAPAPPPIIESASPMSTASETADEPAAVETIVEPEPVAVSEAQAAVFTPSPDIAPVEAADELPATALSPTPTPEMPLTPVAELEAVEPKVKEPEVVEPEFVVAPVTQAPPNNWAVTPDLHPDAPVVEAHQDSLDQAMADGTTAAADKPPFTMENSIEKSSPTNGIVTEEVATDGTSTVGHDIPMEVQAAAPMEPTALSGSGSALGELANGGVASSTGTDFEPTAPVVPTPVAPSPTNPAVSEITQQGMPILGVVPPSSEVPSIVAFPGANVEPSITPDAINNISQFPGQAEAVAPAEAPTNITPFPSQEPLAATGTDDPNPTGGPPPTV